MAEKWPTFPTWMQGLQDELAEIEQTDPAVAAASQRMDDFIWRLTCGVPVARFPRRGGDERGSGGR